MIGIYKITNKINGLVYIGKSRNIEKRFNVAHKNNAKYGRPGLLYDAIREFGFDNFELTILKEVKTFDECKELETYYIDLYNSITPNGYNKSRGPGALGCVFKGKLQYKDKELWRKHVSEANKGKPNYKARGRHLSDETKQKLSDKIKGRPNIKNKGENNGMYGKQPWNKGKHGIYSEETLNKMSKKSKGRIPYNKGQLGVYGWYYDEKTNKRIYFKK